MAAENQQAGVVFPAAELVLPDVAAIVAAGDTSADRIRSLEAEFKALQETKKVKAKEIKKERQKRERLMAKATKNLSIEELSQVLAAKTAAAKAKAKAKGKGKGKAAASPPPPVAALPPPPAAGAAGADAAGPA